MILYPKTTIMVRKIRAEERSLALLTQFKDGFTYEWKFRLPISFRDALDIKQSVRVLNGKTRKIWTQASSFNFKEGDIIYDSSLPHTVPWEKAIRTVGFAIQVRAAQPAGLAEDSEIVATTPISQTTLKIMKDSKGSVSFDLLRSNKKVLLHFKTFTTTQHEFVRFLQCGEMVDDDGNEISIEHLYSEAFPKARSITSSKRAARKTT